MIVIILTYTASPYKSITISLKSIVWRQLVKPSRYQNTIYTNTSRTTTNKFVNYQQLEEGRELWDTLVVPSLSSLLLRINWNKSKYRHQNHPSTSLSSFWKHSDKLSPLLWCFFYFINTFVIILFLKWKQFKFVKLMNYRWSNSTNPTNFQRDPQSQVTKKLNWTAQSYGG